VRAALQKALADQQPVVSDNLSMRIEGKSRTLTLIVEPIVESAGKKQGICVVAFRDASPSAPAVEPDAHTTSPDAVATLEKELNATRFQLRAASDELETSIEDMKSTTEEFQAVNEELQSSNEELETAKEEMQSINEELQTVNSELASKNELLTRLNSDLQNLLDSTRIATVFLDDDLRIRHFTPALTEIFPLRESDHGRPITDLVNLLNYEDLKRDVTEVQTSHAVVQHEVALKDKSATYLLRIQPYKTVTDAIDGVVLTFVDITARKHDEERKLLLADELHHRTQNLLAVIGSIANNTISGDRPVEELREIFSARLHALSKANALLVSDGGQGAELGEIVRAELAGFSERVAIEGPVVRLSPAASQGFSLVIHELATNAAKYGALANGSGNVSVGWSNQAALDGEFPRLIFRWRERGGPTVEAPAHKGFGSSVLERAIDTPRSIPLTLTMRPKD
jgi:two-component system CheB/CheR fusion protein